MKVMEEIGLCVNKRSEQAVAEPKISAVDLFCGVGGLTYGLAQGGIDIAAGIDLDSYCKFPFEWNNKTKFLERDVRELKACDLVPLFHDGAYRLLAGCAPCQPFSTYSRKTDSKAIESKWDLLLDFGRLAKALQPDFVTMENVPQLVNHQIFQAFLDSLRGYRVSYQVVDCVEYGIPQTRKRLVLLASKLGKIELIPATHSKAKPVTVRDVISKLPHIAAGESDPSDALHAACSLSDLNLRRIKASVPGGTWRDWPPQLRADCHERRTGHTYSSVYGRMDWEAPSPTITTQCFGFGNGRFGHPEQHRAISLREAAMIQGFPKKYKFVRPGDDVRFSVLGRLIGNAVPVKLGRAVAQSLINHVQSINNINRNNRRGQG
jgi:DNA (cytosine-5)-methyltransferase 1